MHLSFHSPHVTCYVTTLLCVVIVTCDMIFCDRHHTFCDSDVTPFPCFTFIVVIQLNKWKWKLKMKIENNLVILPSHDKGFVIILI